jgi:hypothetical protein
VPRGTIGRSPLGHVLSHLAQGCRRRTFPCTFSRQMRMAAVASRAVRGNSKRCPALTSRFAGSKRDAETHGWRRSDRLFTGPPLGRAPARAEKYQ